MRCDDLRIAADIEDYWPKHSGGAVDGRKEQAEEQEERCHFGEKQFPQWQRERQQNLIIAAIEEQGIPFENDDERNHYHGKPDEEAADGNEIPACCALRSKVQEERNKPSG